MEFVGTSSFDIENSDWACDEIFVIRDMLLIWKEETTWKAILTEVTSKIEAYLENGRYSEKLKAYAGISVGFVDGDICIVYQK